jgi:hypothetical protein
LGTYQVAILVITVIFVYTDSTGFDPSSPDWPYYKNSAFANCSMSSPTHVNCTMLHDHLDSLPSELTQQGDKFLMYLTYNAEVGYNDTPMTYTWCELASCLKGFKVVPSSPRPSAFGYSGIMIWSFLNMMSLTALWSLRKLFVARRHEAKDCPGQGFIDWVCNVYDLGAFVFWWHSFCIAAPDPYTAAPISIMAWVTAWRYAYMAHYHPLSCWLKLHLRWKWPVRGSIYFAVVAQWVATCYIFHSVIIALNSDTYPKYNCLESLIPTAPGTSNCSSAELCAKN